jgi:hypothetical protein
VRPVQGNRPRTRHPVLRAAGGALLRGMAIALAVAACTASPGTSAKPAAAAGGPGEPAASNTVVAPGSPASCTGAPLKAQLAAAVLAGASLIVATGTPTGTSVTGKSLTGKPATAGAPAFYALTLTAVQTLRGPAVASGSIAWVEGPAHGTPATPVNSALLAPGGRLFAIAWPKAATRGLAGPLLQLAPIVGADVVFTPYACWNLTGLVPDQYQASTPLRPVPSGANYGGTHQAAENGLYTVPLATVKRVAASA